MPSDKTDVQSHTFVYKHASGIDIHLDLLLPTAHTRSPLPIFYWHHGGGAIQGRREAVPPHLKHAANTHGFAIVSPDYRLAPQVRWPDIASDLVDAFKFAIDELPKKTDAKLDTHNVLVSGSSVGGFLALSLALGLCPTLALGDSAAAPYLARIRGVPIIYPITNWNAPFWAEPQVPFLGRLSDDVVHDPLFAQFCDPSAPVIANTDESSGVPALRNKFYMYAQQTAPKTGFQQLVFGEQLVQQGWLQRSNTVAHVRAHGAELKKALGNGAGARIYVVHGDADAAVAVEQARTLRDAAKEAGIPLEYEELAGIDHMFDYKPEITLDKFYAWTAKAFGIDSA